MKDNEMVEEAIQELKSVAIKKGYVVILPNPDVNRHSITGRGIVVWKPRSNTKFQVKVKDVVFFNLSVVEVLKIKRVAYLMIPENNILAKML